MTRQQIRNVARKALGETTSAFWSDDELNNYINLGCHDLAWRTKCLRTQTTTNSISCDPVTTSGNVGVPKSNEYKLSSIIPNYFAVTEVYFKLDGQRYRRMEPSSREELDALFPGWQSTLGYTLVDTTTNPNTYTYNYNSKTSIPTRYYWSREEDLFGLYPAPNDQQQGSDYIKLYYTFDHTDIASDTAAPTIPTGIHLAIVDFVVGRGLEDRGWVDRANDSWEKYYKKISDYFVERGREREDEEVVSKGYRNLQ